MSPLKDKVDALEIAIPFLPYKDRDFAGSLVKGFKKYNSLSPKQVYWVEILLKKALGQDNSKPAAVEIGDFKGVLALFAKAKAALKFPKINLYVSGNPVVLSVAGPKSKAPGSVNVTDGGKFGSNKYYGRVSPDGAFQAGFKDYPEAGEVLALLKALAENPEKVAHDSGKLSGYCCFCNKSLSDPQSTAAGYGPVCAKNWGLLSQYKEAEAVL